MGAPVGGKVWAGVAHPGVLILPMKPLETTASVSNTTPRTGRRVFGVAFMVLLLLTALLTALHLQRRAVASSDTSTHARQSLRDSAATIDAAFLTAQHLGDAIAADLASGSLPFAELPIRERLRADLEAAPDVNGLAITFEPFAYDPSLRLFQIYMYRTPQGAIEELVGATYDYTRPPSDDPDAPKTAWYYNTIRSGPNWSDPFLATGAGKVLIEYARPFAHPDGRKTPAGVVTSDLSLQEVRNLLARLDLGAQGYGFVIGRNGVLLDYPDRTRVARGSIFDADSGFDPEVQAAARRALAGETLELRHRDTLTERDTRLFFAPLPTSGSALALLIDAAEFQLPADRILRDVTTIALAAAGTLILGLALFSAARLGVVVGAWFISLAFSATCLALIVLVWRLDARLTREATGALTSQAAVERVLERYRRELDPQDEPFVVPTGVQLTAVQFPDATSVTVGGFVWQFYRNDIPAEVHRGFNLSQELGELMPVEEVARAQRGDGEVIVWRINTTLQQGWNPVKFPFDERAIHLRLLPAELEQNVVLTPDLESYVLLRPGALPGVDQSVQITNWRFERSYFSLAPSGSNATLGLTARAVRAAPPTLQFSLVTRRNVVGPFIAYVLPGVITLGLVFAFLLSDRQLTDSRDLVAALSYTAALFFVIALLHTTLRESVAAVGITYLEHLYLLLYVVILLVTVIAFLIVHVPGMIFVSSQHNFLPRLLFWPLCMGALLLSTLVIFVYG